jgi:hypothetical protein
MADERMAICIGARIALILVAAYTTHLAGLDTPWSALLGASGHRTGLVLSGVRCLVPRGIKR